jgi:hypothetical protein
LPFSPDGGHSAYGAFSTADVLSRLRADIEAIAARATETRRRLQRGEAINGMTGLVAIENRCQDALAMLDTVGRHPAARP